MNQEHIRNFAIIAHIDHGKSTLADRLLEITGTVKKREMSAMGGEQVLDSNPIERERGITIKLAPVRMAYRHGMKASVLGITHNTKYENHNTNGEYILNLIDTPGHVDFSYEVSRSLAACEGAILVVDATQGIQAQTIANFHQAQQHNLTIIPVINKIDLPNARIAETRAEIETLGFRKEEIIEISAKTGKNVESVLEAIVERIPAPTGGLDKPLRALVFSSQYDAHKGVVVFVRVVDGYLGSDLGISKGLTPLRFVASRAQVTPIEIGYFTPKMTPCDTLNTGEVGYIATGLKDVRFAKVGDTITLRQAQGELMPLPGYKEPKPMVFLGLFPIQIEDLTASREAMEKLRLSDSAFTFRPVASLALGHGFHCGFLGLLHAEIVQERLAREFGLNMIATAPSVEYHIGSKSIQSAAEFPDMASEVQEPIMEVKIYTPKRFVGAVMQLAAEKRGEYVDLRYLTGSDLSDTKGLTPKLAQFTYLVPFSEMIIDFFDRLKSVTEGYASLDYDFLDYKSVDVVKVDILVNHEKIDALSFLVVTPQARHRAISIVDRLAEVIPRAQFSIPIQGAIGGQIIARADVKPFRKDVIQKLYGGDRTRKDKLLEAQKKGKAKMKMVGKVEIPQSAFFEVLRRTS